MAMIPSRVKYRKMHRGSRTGLATRGNTVAFGEYGLMSLERCWLDTKQIEAARVAINRNMKRRGKVWIRVFPQPWCLAASRCQRGSTRPSVASHAARGTRGRGTRAGHAVTPHSFATDATAKLLARNRRIFVMALVDHQTTCMLSTYPPPVLPDPCRDRPWHCLYVVALV